MCKSESLIDCVWDFVILDNSIRLGCLSGGETLSNSSQSFPHLPDLFTALTQGFALED